MKTWGGQDENKRGFAETKRHLIQIEEEKAGVGLEKVRFARTLSG